jgi:hypothetical protein
MSAELILHMSVSLDGFVAHSDGVLDWHAPDAGLPLMHGLPEPQRLELISSTTYSDGCVAQVFRS